MDREIVVTFVDENLERAYDALAEGTYEDKKLYELLTEVMKLIRKNPFGGIRIPRKLIPKEYNATVLYKINLTKSWRLVYSVSKTRIEIMAIILEWFPHKKYERRFKY
jgi:Txe/YoeB family toxin of Txe-Axe toxin-antitoxin module